MIKKVILFLFSLHSMVAENKIIYLITHPRSCSTIFMRTFEHAKKLEIFNEPCMSPFVKEEKPEWKLTFKQTAYRSYQDMINDFEKIRKESNVFVKEMAFSSNTFLINNSSFVKKPNIHFVFLVRDPHATFISLYKKLTNHHNAEIEYYKQIYELFKYIQIKAFHSPLLLLTEDFHRNPQHITNSLYKLLKTTHPQGKLKFRDLGDNFDGELWHQQKIDASFYHWHGKAIRSTELLVPKQYEVDNNGVPTFSEIEEKYRELYKSVYAKNLIYYKRLLEETSHFLS